MFLSFNAAPRYLNDEAHVLFSYLGMLLRGLKESFAETEETLAAFVGEQSHVYDPGKKAKGEQWDSDADWKARRHWRHCLFALHNSLDLVADLAALMLTGVIPRLRLGKAEFTRVEEWLKEPLKTQGRLITPAQDVAARLHADLGCLVVSKGSERGWLPYLRHLRNKAAHLGDATFREFGLHDKNLDFYVFIPRIWPLIWEQEIKPHSKTKAGAKTNMPEALRKTLIHEDIVSFTRGAVAKVRAIVECGVQLMSDYYTQSSEFPLNRAALEELDGSSSRFTFEHFV